MFLSRRNVLTRKDLTFFNVIFFKKAQSIRKKTVSHQLSDCTAMFPRGLELLLLNVTYTFVFILFTIGMANFS
jgi:hypothetical protein